MQNLSATGGKNPRTRGQTAIDFKSAQTGVAATAMRNELARLSSTIKDPEMKQHFNTEMENFFILFNRYLTDKAQGARIDWDKIEPLKEDQVVPYSALPQNVDPSVLNKLAVLKLNGGLGTTMGCVGPKSVIEVRDGMTFLDLSVRQIEHLNSTHNVNVPFILMNSFNTDEDTARIIQKYGNHNLDILTFNQSRYPRINRDSLLPVPRTATEDKGAWYPPGHGDLFDAIYTNSGLVDRLLEAGKEYIFVSNSDNLGAVTDLSILQHMVDTGAEFIMEVTDKTKADVKGGTLINYEGKIRLLEIAQVPNEHVEDFKSVRQFKIFNTNSLWINLRAIKRIMDSDGLDLEIIVNNKSTDSGEPVIQLETASGAAIKHFNNAHAVNVPRSRFLPVKSCSDLLLVTSDLYTLSHGALVMNPKRMFQTTPVIKLGDHFKKVGQFQKRFKKMPSMLELDHLTVSGDVSFGRGVTLRGTVIIVANEGQKIELPDGTVLENKLVSGNLSIIEH